MSVSFRAVVVGKILEKLPSGEEVVRIDLAEEKPAPPPIIMDTSRLEQSEIAREVLPVVSQMLSSLPISRATVRVPRVTLVLTRDEWDQLQSKPDLGDELTVTIVGSDIRISKP
ncbi:MAG: arcadin 1 [Candidatus Bathyarchaeota archaeon]|nr:arcadin 1 [Candidatus Bathyarchaeota archaeon]